MAYIEDNLTYPFSYMAKYNPRNYIRTITESDKDVESLADGLKETLSESIPELEATLFDKVRTYAEMKERNDPSSDRALKELHSAKEKLSSFLAIKEIAENLF